MSQTSMSTNFSLGIAGAWATSAPGKVLSGPALENIEFGRMVAYGTSQGIRKPLQNSLDIVFDADLVTSNTINGSIKVRQIGSTSFTTTTLAQTTFSSTHAATMGVIAGLIEAITGIADCTVGGSNNRTLLITATEGYEVEIGATVFVVAAGGSQAGVTYVRGSDDTIIGVALHENKEKNSDGTALYESGDAVNVAYQGEVWVLAQDTVLINDSVYAAFVGSTAERGEVRNTADSAPVEAIAVSGARFRSAASADGLVRVEFNQP